MANAHCTWTSFYMELADKLLPFKNKRRDFIDRLEALFARADMKLPTLDSVPRPVDIDPYTVFGLFNKGITDANRRKLIASFANEFGVTAKQPDDFDGVPVLNNLNATFYAFAGDKRRGEHDIDNLWRVFETEIALAAVDNERNRAAFKAAYDAVIGQFGLGWKLTMGLYWVRPFTFINLDSRNRWFLHDKAGAGRDVARLAPGEKRARFPRAGDYLALCDAVRARLGSDECPYKDYPSISYAAWVDPEHGDSPAMETVSAAQRRKDNALGDADVEAPRYWLFAPGENASMWDEFYDRGVMGIGWSELGDLSAYATKEDMRIALLDAYGDESTQRHSAHAVWQFSHDVKPGDVVFAKQGRTKILGRGVVTGGYVYDPDGGHYPNLCTVRWTHKGVWTNDGAFTTKTLTDVTPYTEFVEKLNALFESEAGVGVEAPAVAYPRYGKAKFLAEVFMDEGRYDVLAGVLRAKKNVILQGAPGVGKTFAAKRLAYSMMGVKDADRVMMVQFHQSYGYEDFIEGFRPSSTGFELAKGSFYTFCKKAAEDTDNDYFFIIDEINRGNLSKIFGELFMLIEGDKRGPKNKVQLLYSREQFYVPGNLYLIGTMNTADRSLALLDFALRRRFAFFDLEPGFETAGFAAYLDEVGNPKLNKLVACVVRLNEAIAADETLGEGFRIGHSYFCGMGSEEAVGLGDAIDAKLTAVVEYELVPLLREYWFDEPAKVREWVDALRRSVK